MHAYKHPRVPELIDYFPEIHGEFVELRFSHGEAVEHWAKDSKYLVWPAIEVLKPFHDFLPTGWGMSLNTIASDKLDSFIRELYSFADSVRHQPPSNEVIDPVATAECARKLVCWIEQNRRDASLWVLGV